MDKSVHPRVVVGIDSSAHGLAALRAAVAEARLRRIPLYAVRCHTSAQPENGPAFIDAAFQEALGSIPGDIEVHTSPLSAPLVHSLVSLASDPRDLIVVGTSRRGALHMLLSGSAAARLRRGTRCPVLVVPAPELARTASARKRIYADRADVWEQFDSTVSKVHGRRHFES